MNAKSIRVGLFALALLALTLDAQAGRRFIRPGPTLDNPAPNAVITQNDPATGCTLDPTRGYGFMITFDWTSLRTLGAKTFTLVLQHTGAIAPALHEEGLTDTTYALVDCNSFVVDQNLANWYWQVLLVNANGQTRALSERRPLSFAPCRLSSGLPCNAP